MTFKVDFVMAGWWFGDVRLSDRAAILYDRIVATGSLVLRRIGGDRAGEIAAHRFLDNEAVSVQAIIDTLSLRTIEACKGRTVIAVQDTSEINFAGRDASRSGLGEAGGDKSVGFFIHPLIAVDAEAGAVLGPVDADIWTRQKLLACERRKLKFGQKESVRWLDMIESAKTRLAGAAQTIVVGDRESDIYSLFARRPGSVELIVRAAHNRQTQAGRRLFEASPHHPERVRELGKISVEIAAIAGRKARTASLTLRAGQVDISKPKDSFEDDEPASVRLNLVEVIEQNPPKGAKPVVWRLLTTLTVTNLAQAQLVVQYYRLRWRIEEVFRALKSNGLDLEATQVEAADRLFKLAALGLAAACRIVQLVDARNGSPRPASDVADERLFEAFDHIGQTLQGKTKRQQNPHAKGSLAWLAWIAARLGGWNCYYKPPGPKTMATGWKQLATMTTGYLIATSGQDV